MQKSPVIIVATMLLLVCASVVFGFDPMGPPKATLKQGQPSVGIEYLYGNMDLESFGTPFLPETFVVSEASEIDLNDLQINKISGIFGYGLSDSLEIFGRVGMAAADVDSGANPDHFGGLIGSSNFDFSIGAGARATIFEWKDISVGVLAQVSVVQLDGFDDYSAPDFLDRPVTVSTELTMIEVQLALGPTWNCTENFSIYGGPFLHFVDGDVDRTATISGFRDSDSLDISERGIWGGYIGATVFFSKSPNINCNVEFQATGGGYAVAIQLAISP